MHAATNGLPFRLGTTPRQNANFEMEYLSGGDDFFGPNFGGANVHTNVRKGYLQECPNVGKLLTGNLFSCQLENEIMGAILDDGKNLISRTKNGLSQPRRARTWLEASPQPPVITA